MHYQRMPKNKSLDLLGIQPVAEAVNKFTSAVVDGASAFLSRICLPAAEEFGLYLKDRVRLYRTQNMADIALKAEKNLAEGGAPENVQAHPRLIGSILENGSWIADAEVRDMWLVSSLPLAQNRVTTIATCCS